MRKYKFIHGLISTMMSGRHAACDWILNSIHINLL